MFAVTLMIISAVVGAGFATGAELIAFFGTSTLPPIIIAALVGFFLFCIIATLMYFPLNINKKLFAPVYFVFFVAMTAGITELTGPIAAAIAVIISILIVLFGFEKMLSANKILMSFALSVLLIVVILCIGGSLPKSDLPFNIWSTAGNALLYAGMNCCMLPAVLAEAKKTISRKKLLVCIFIAAITIAFFAMLLLTAIRVNNVGDAAMPILALADNFVVVLAVFICILTSMFAALFNLCPNTAEGASKKSIFILCGIGVLGYLLSFLGFTKVIGTFYPIVGILMLGAIAFSFCLFLKDYFVCRRIHEH